MGGRVADVVLVLGILVALGLAGGRLAVDPVQDVQDGPGRAVASLPRLLGQHVRVAAHLDVVVAFVVGVLRGGGDLVGGLV